MGKRIVEKYESLNGKKAKLTEGITPRSLVKNDVTGETTLPGSNDTQQQNSITTQCMDLEFTSNSNNNCTDGQFNGIEEIVSVNQPSLNFNQSKPRPKTAAERSREYRERLRAVRQENQNHVASRSAPKTPAERSREYRARQKELLLIIENTEQQNSQKPSFTDNKSKMIPKTSAERNREYWAQLSQKYQEENEDGYMTLNDISNTNETINEPINGTNNEPTKQIGLSNTSNKKKKCLSQDLLGKAYSVLSEKEDDIDVFGKFVASELRGLQTDHSRKKAKRQIQRILLDIAEEDDAKLSTTHHLILKSEFK